MKINQAESLFSPSEADFSFDECDVLMADQSFMGDGITLLKKRKKLELIEADKKDTLINLLTGKISKDSTLHILSNCSFDGFSFIPALLELYGSFDLFYGSTWTINHSKINLLAKYVESGQLGTLYFLSDSKFKSAETAQFATLMKVINQFGGKLRVFQNHSKITLLKNDQHNFVIAGSANYTANPRVEQFTFDDCEELFEFYETWFKRLLEI